MNSFNLLDEWVIQKEYYNSKVAYYIHGQYVLSNWKIWWIIDWAWMSKATQDFNEFLWDIWKIWVKMKLKWIDEPWNLRNKIEWVNQ